VLIDDDWIALSRLRKIIEQNSDLVVVAACRCATGAMLAVERHRPAVLILDVRLTDRDGIELIREITAKSDAKVIVFTRHGDTIDGLSARVGVRRRRLCARALHRGRGRLQGTHRRVRAEAPRNQLINSGRRLDIPR